MHKVLALMCLLATLHIFGYANCQQMSMLCCAESVVRLLHLNAPQNAIGTTDDEIYKVLVLDRFTKDVVAPLLRVNDLRRHGITLHLMISTDRQPIPDVPAVYLIQPTEENILRVSEKWIFLAISFWALKCRVDIQSPPLAGLGGLQGRALRLLPPQFCLLSSSSSTRAAGSRISLHILCAKDCKSLRSVPLLHSLGVWPLLPWHAKLLSGTK